MKKILPLLFLSVPAFFTSNESEAQSMIFHSSHHEYQISSCVVPQDWQFYYYAGTEHYLNQDSVHIYMDFGDGNDTLLGTVNYLNNSIDGFVSIPNGAIDHTYLSDGIYTVTYITTMSDGNADTLHLAIMVTSTCNNITGRMYEDVNANCIYDAGDVAPLSASIGLSYNGMQVQSAYPSTGGLFTMSAIPGYTYSIYIDSANGPALPLMCSSYSGMNITPLPNASQDLIVGTATSVNLTDAFDSSAMYTGYCTPFYATLNVNGYAYNYTNPNDSITIYYNFGDGNDSTIKIPVNQIGSPVFWINSWMSHTYTAPGSYSIYCSATAPDGKMDTIIRNNKYVILDTCGNVQGRMYLDNNMNCVFDAGDYPMNGTPITLTDLATGTPYWACTDANGFYNFRVSSGNYSLNTYYISNFSGVVPVCPASGSAPVTVISSNTSTQDFSFSCPNTFDFQPVLNVNLGISNTSISSIRPYYMNHTCDVTPGSVQLILDPLVHYVGTCDTSFHPTVNGDTLTWNFAGIGNFLSWYYWYGSDGCILVIADPSTHLGDTVCYTMTMFPLAGDANPANNTTTACSVVGIPYDPNIKTVSPQGTGPQGNVGQNTTFDYHVEFQNTGNAPAHNIFVLDTLDADFDIATLIVTGSSHSMQTQMLPGNVIRFYYSGIDLPDSASDEPHSHGWLSYRIAAKPNLPNGTQIQNTAGIYFDFNAPVITNSTLNTIYDPASVHEIVEGDVSIFPNPASSSFEIVFANEMNATLHLTDLAGQEVMNEKVNGIKATIDVRTLPVGVYILKVESENGTSVHKIVVQY